MSWAGIGKTQWDNTQFDRQEGMGTEERGRLRALEAENSELLKKAQFLEWENGMLKGHTNLREACDTLLKIIQTQAAQIRELSEQNRTLVKILDDSNRPDASVDF